MVSVQDLFDRQADDDGELSYTDKQTKILEIAIENTDVSVDEIAEMADAHVTYVRNVLERADQDEVKERLAKPEQSVEDDEEVDDEAADLTEPDIEPEQSKVSLVETDPVRLSVTVPSEVVDDIVPESEEWDVFDEELVAWFSEQFDVGTDRARRTIARIGTARAEEIKSDEFDEETLVVEA